MNLILSGRGVDLDEPLRRYATEKFTRAQRFFDRIIQIDVELRHERNPRVENRERVEVTVKTPVQTLRVHGEGLDHFAAIDVAADRLETQVRKVKDRLVDRHNHHKTKNNYAPLPEEPAAESPEVVRVMLPVDKPLSVDEAHLELTSLGLAFLPFVEAETMRPAVLYRRDDGTLGLVDYEG